MAENTSKPENSTNFVEQKPSDPVDATMNDVNSSAVSPIEPATVENQEQTEQASEFESKLQEKKRLLSRNTGRKTADVDDLEAQELLLRDIKKQEQKDSAAADAKFIENNQQQAEIDLALEKYKNLKQEYTSRGMDFKTNENFEKLISEKDQQASAAANQILEQQQQELEKQQALEQAQIQQQAEVEKQAMQKEQAVATAQDQLQKQKIESVAKKQKALQEQIEKEDAELKNIDPDRYWNSKSTGQKIMAGIGLVLAGMGAGATGQPNAALQVIQNAIDNDIKAQKLNAEQALAKKKHALNIVELQLKKLDSSTNNQLKKVQIQKLMQEMQQSQIKLQESRLMAKKLTSNDGLTREEVFGLDPKLQERMVMLSDGNFRPALSEQLAKKLNQETIPQSKDAIRGLTRLKEIMNQPAAELRLSLRAEAATIKQALKGSLRLELFGPGVMTDFESKMADKIIGDPTKILTMDSMEKAKFDALLKKVKQGTIDKIRQAGVHIPKTKNEKILDQFMSKNKKTSRPEAINALIKLGYWDENADVGF